MEQLNKIELRGRIGNAGVSSVGNGKVCHFSVATGIVYRNSAGETVEENTWHHCTLWSGKKYPDLDFIKVGKPVELTGRMKMSKYTGSDGQEKLSAEVVVSQITILPDGTQLSPASML